MSLDTENVAKKLRYPVSVFFIIISKFCERFCYYGMKTVLSLYLRCALMYDEDESTVFLHLFTMFSCFTPIFGAVLGDSFLGQYRTIVYLSILYAFGNILLAVASVPNILPQVEFSFVALFIIALGTGATKPCISAFAGDQFERPQQDKELEQFFSLLHFTMHAGLLIATFVTPILRQSVECFGQESCFPLAFGVPAILMVVSVAIFLFGNSSYRIKEPKGNVIVEVIQCSWHAIYRKARYFKVEKHDHWLDFASDKFDKQLIADIKQVLCVLLLYLPVPAFWALIDQQGSRWIYQATRMDGVLGSITILPDQIQIIGPLLTLALVPILESLIYPVFAKCGLLTPLQRMGTGGILAAISFILSGFLELSLEPTYASIPEAGFTHLHFINSLPCPVNISYTNNNATKWTELNANGFSLEQNLKNDPTFIIAQLSSFTCGDLHFTSTEWSGTISGGSAQAYSVIAKNNNGNLELVRMKEEEQLEKSTLGQSRLSFIMNPPGIKNIRIVGNAAFDFSALEPDAAQTKAEAVDYGTYDVYLFYEKESADNGTYIGKIELFQGACYTLFVQHGSNIANYVQSIEISPSNSISMLWQVPQRFIATVADLMFSITGIQFSFTQGPERMKSVMQACWLLTIAFGNVFVIVVAKTQMLDRQSIEFFLFAGLLILHMLVFFYLAARYTYIESDPVYKDKRRRLEENSRSVKLIPHVTQTVTENTEITHL